MKRGTGVLVVGASAAGLATAEALRREGYRGRITVLGAEPHLPYDRPPLSKQILSGQWRAERTLLRPPRLLAGLDLELILDTRALALDAATRTVQVRGGSITADHVVIATGAAPRTLPTPPALRGVHVLRTLDDALALRAGLGDAQRVVVVGEGVLGSEIAATAGELGRDVTLCGPLSAPMAGQLGDLVSARLGALHRANGVRLELGAAVDGLTDRNGEVTGVALAGGAVLPADLVVVAIGAAPVTGWLDGSGLSLRDGVVCDACCRAAEGVYAAGDVARWRHPGLGAEVRWENRTNATEQAAVVAAAIAGTPRPHAPISYFWTDQFGTKIQVHGTVTRDATAGVVDGDPDDGRFVVRYERDGAVTAVLGWNMAKQARIRRQELIDGRADPVPQESRSR
ncbi:MULTISPECIES: NAD(P)/FAD-dependent oxidoreductase [unclassified Nocardia]|uniref:NAD(P)/FAD-dependent oxidoreductase n=1 Tax=unclassified Nocardia TaxID=2637762 RepID=UPI0033A0194A